jgi:CSLREA domain-containing protein
VAGLRQRFARFAAALVVVSGLLASPMPALAAGVINVDTVNDDNGGNPADCSLREAIATANTNANVSGCTGGGGGSPFTINVPAGTYNLLFGQLEIGAANLDVTLQGAGSATTIVQVLGAPCATSSRLFNVDVGGSGNSKVAFNDLTIRNGTAITGGGAIRVSSPASSVAVSNSVISGNCAVSGSNGGGIVVPSNTVGSLSVTNSTLSANTAQGGGGAVWVAGSGVTASLTNSIFSGNTAMLDGGAVLLGTSGTFVIGHVEGNTFTGNATVTGNGGAISFGGGQMFVGTTAANVFIGNAAVINTTTEAMYGGPGSNGFAVDNWYGCNQGPANAACDTASSGIGGTMIFAPWLILTNTASPNSIPLNHTATLTADFLHDSNGTLLPASRVAALQGRAVSWSNAINGSLSNQQTTIQSTGTATATFTPAAQGAGSADATVDSATATANLTVTAPVDTDAPVVSNVNAMLREGGHIGSVSVIVSWSATDDLTPTNQLVFQIQRRRLRMTGWKAWQDVATVTGQTSIYQVPLWHRYQYRVRATDTAGHTGDWSDAWPITFIRRDERSFTRDASWTVTPVTGSMRGRVARSSTPGGTASLAFTGNGVALVTPTGSGQGTVQACLNAGTAAEQ